MDRAISFALASQHYAMQPQQPPPPQPYGTAIHLPQLQQQLSAGQAAYTPAIPMTPHGPVPVQTQLTPQMQMLMNPQMQMQQSMQQQGMQMQQQHGIYQPAVQQLER